MSYESDLLNRLIRAQDRYAASALKSPQDKSAFEYGTHVGVMKGFALAIQELENMVAEARRDDDL